MNKEEFTDMIILAKKGTGIYPNTNLPITLWLKINNEKIIYMQNNYNKYTTDNDLIPISIDEYNPKLVYDVKLGISKKEFPKISEWEFIVTTWLMNYENSALDENQSMPNYMNLN